MANKHRGEIELTLGGRTFLLRPTFEALVEFEDKSGMTAFEALKSLLESQRAPAKAVAAAFWAGIRAAWKSEDGRCPSFGEIGLLIQKDGLKSVIENYSKFLTFSISSDEEVEKMREVSEGKEGSG